MLFSVEFSSDVIVKNYLIGVKKIQFYLLEKKYLKNIMKSIEQLATD